jgi:hypothetical protein
VSMRPLPDPVFSRCIVGGRGAIIQAQITAWRGWAPPVDTGELTMQRTSFFTWLLVWLPTQIVSLAAATFLFTLGLILIEFLLYPLALGISALLAGVTAVWASDRVVRDGLQASAEAVVLRCEAAAAVLSLILIAVSASGRAAGPVILASSASAVVLAVVATYGAITQRVPAQGSQRRRILLWLLLAVIAIPMVIFIAAQFGWAGA